MFWTVFSLLAVERLFELWLSRRNQRRLAARGARWVRPDGYGPLLAVNVALFAGLAAEHAWAPWSGTHAATWPLVGLALGAQGLRYWAVATLGERWCTRVVVLPGHPPVARGPYRFVRHPNYVAVVVEFLVVPLAFGLVVTALVLSAANGLALWRRIRIEERALSDAAAAA